MCSTITEEQVLVDKSAGVQSHDFPDVLEIREWLSNEGKRSVIPGWKSWHHWRCSWSLQIVNESKGVGQPSTLCLSSLFNTVCSIKYLLLCITETIQHPMCWIVNNFITFNKEVSSCITKFGEIVERSRMTILLWAVTKNVTLLATCKEKLGWMRMWKKEIWGCN